MLRTPPTEGSAGVRHHDDARLPAIEVQDEQRTGFERGSVPVDR